MTPEQALQNVEIICRQYGGYTLATARAVEESLAVLRTELADKVALPTKGAPESPQKARTKAVA